MPQGFPLLWHHIGTPESRERGGTSVMNHGELYQVQLYVQKIVHDLHVQPREIGIISPYTYQVIRVERSWQRT
jgi:hypothetical protein